jgi:three-Cys-motif partner protein
MGIISEPKIQWGGRWTEEKLDAFESYVNAYLNIMNAQKKKYNGWPTTFYFDGFAGSGSRGMEKGNGGNLFDNYFIQGESDVYQGSAERVLKLEKKFDYYYFVDRDKATIELLEKTLTRKNLVNYKCKFIYDDVNNKLKVFSNTLGKGKAALVLLDPFGMQIDWASIELLKGKKVDLWILVPSGVIINRLLDKKGKLLFEKKLEAYFGMNVEEIKKMFYRVEEVRTLFGVENTLSKVDNSINQITKIYVEKLKRIFKFVTDEPLRLFNSKNVPIYHFVFASNNETAYKIANQIIEKKQK